MESAAGGKECLVGLETAESAISCLPPNGRKALSSAREWLCRPAIPMPNCASGRRIAPRNWEHAPLHGPPGMPYSRTA